MKFKKIFIVLSVFILGILTADGYASDSIKERMINRLPAIKDLKARGVVGENKLGFLEFVGNQKEKADVVEAENMDRKTVYEAIAKRQGATVELVGQHRAVQIADKARPGEWLQDANGKWYKKQ
jgi:uncharacterized protein YdbL (DUF1318 family)